MGGGSSLGSGFRTRTVVFAHVAKVARHAGTVGCRWRRRTLLELGTVVCRWSKFVLASGFRFVNSVRTKQPNEEKWFQMVLLFSTNYRMPRHTPGITFERLANRGMRKRSLASGDLRHQHKAQFRHRQTIHLAPIDDLAFILQSLLG